MKNICSLLGPELSEVGRTCMDEFLKKEAYLMFEEDGEKYVASRRSLYVTTQEGYVLRSSNLLGDLDLEKGRSLVQIALSRDEAVVTQSLLTMGAPAPLHSNPSKSIACFNRYALVGIGPRARSFWRQSASLKDGFRK